MSDLGAVRKAGKVGSFGKIVYLVTVAKISPIPTYFQTLSKASSIQFITLGASSHQSFPKNQINKILFMYASVSQVPSFHYLLESKY
jgi:hypothetical protein